MAFAKPRNIDSATIFVPVDSLFKDASQPIPPFLKRGTDVRFIVKIKKSQSRADFEKEMYPQIKESELIDTLQYAYSDLPYYILKKYFEKEKVDALIIWQTLSFVRENKDNFSPIELKEQAFLLFNNGKLKLEYLDIVNAENLLEAMDWSEPTVCCIAAYCGNVRLIDNLLL